MLRRREWEYGQVANYAAINRLDAQGKRNSHHIPVDRTFLDD